MKKELLLIAVTSVVLMGCEPPASEVDSTPELGTVLDTEEKRVSYGMGVGLGERITQDNMQIDADAFAAGMKDAIEGAELQMTKDEIMAEMQAFQQQQVAAQQAELEQVADQNLAEGKAFLLENGAKEGVVTLESGLQYKVITEGAGEKPSATDTVEVHYSGKLLDGTEFDSSYQRGATVSFPVNGVIPGWTEALQLMPVGSKWALFIPSDLAYGPGGTGGGPIGPNATLVFDVELISIKAAEEAPAK